ncbi:hypothetical protein [Clostridium vincentii]|uniref:Rod shape-determining protein MreD n=1 Tax=Clostridium vincentii TaxID=52704 RepID=A0A2T0BB82_9CLOT|nr:hypothetical protein [Clostridium vincentii]PRR81093.1 hypothetical protein CLVI_27670 [Clostridium vincentii]
MKAKDITLGGIMVALGIMTLYLTTIIPVNTLSILTLASCFIPITILRSNIRTACFVYVATALMSFFIVPINYAIMYTLLFGIYGIVKYFIEKIRKIPIEIILKLLFFNIVLSIGIVFMNAFISELTIDFPTWILYLISQPAFLLYDFAITTVITFYLQKSKKFKI